MLALIIIFIIILIKRRKKDKDDNQIENSDASVIIPELANSNDDDFENEDYASFENPLRDEVPEADPFDNDFIEDI